MLLHLGKDDENADALPVSPRRFGPVCISSKVGNSHSLGSEYAGNGGKAVRLWVEQRTILLSERGALRSSFHFVVYTVDSTICAVHTRVKGYVAAANAEKSNRA